MRQELKNDLIELGITKLYGTDENYINELENDYPYLHDLAVKSSDLFFVDVKVDTTSYEIGVPNFKFNGHKLKIISSVSNPDWTEVECALAALEDLVSRVKSGEIKKR